MKKIVLVVVLVGVLVFFYQTNTNKEKEKTINIKQDQGIVLFSPTPTRTPVIVKKSLFMPAWSLKQVSQEALSVYDRLYYFGLTPSLNGINMQGAEYKQMEEFFSLTSATQEAYITLKMTNTDTTSAILKSHDAQEKVITDMVTIVQEHHIKGIALDIEISGLISSDVQASINTFVQQMYYKAKSHTIRLSLILYGDLFYRKRPYDIKTLSANVDEVMVMAYDFHKAGGEPGPNFPFSGKEIYGYDFKQMTEDFLAFVPPEKLTIIFGMYGYDWTVDEKRKPITSAKAMTLHEIRTQFLDTCEWKDCIVKRDDVSKETEVNYVYSEVKDNFGYMYYHIVWFEDEESVRIKSDYLKEKGIGSTAYWAYTYF